MFAFDPSLVLMYQSDFYWPTSPYITQQNIQNKFRGARSNRHRPFVPTDSSHQIHPWDDSVVLAVCLSCLILGLPRPRCEAQSAAFNSFINQATVCAVNYWTNSEETAYFYFGHDGHVLQWCALLLVGGKECLLLACKHRKLTFIWMQDGPYRRICSSHYPGW